MLIEFSVANFRSFNQKRTISFEVSKAIKDTPLESCFESNGSKYLRSIALYGANSGGKSNLLRAVGLMGTMLLESVKLNDKDKLDYQPFLLSTVSLTRPTLFEMLFALDGVRYRYGFEYNEAKIIGEWLFSKTGAKKEQPFFIRTEEGVGVEEKYYKEGVGLEERTNDNRLFLSLVAQLGGAVSKQVVEWFESGYNVISGLQSKGYQGYSKVMFHKKMDGCEGALRFMQQIQLGFQSVEIEEKVFEASSLPDDMPAEIKAEILQQLSGKKQLDLVSVHNRYNSKGKVVESVRFDFKKFESAGTNKLMDISGPIFNALFKGSALFVDELDAKMHPLISERLIKLFNDPQTNPNKAQLLFTTHDTHLLSGNFLRRDQVWFAEKDQCEQTDLYSLIDIILPNGTKPRNDSNYEKNYIAGRYGAIPFMQ